MVPPGEYNLIVTTLPLTLYRNLKLQEASKTLIKISLGSFKALSPGREELTVHVYDATINKRLGFYGGTVFFAPGNYQVDVNNSRSETIAIAAGETKEILLGAIKPLTPDKKEIPVNFYDAMGKRLGYYGGIVPLIPGKYQIEINNSRSKTITINGGEIKEVILGAIRVHGSVTIFDSTGKRVGYYADTIILTPGNYKVVDSNQRSYDNVIVKAGEITVVK